MFRFMFCALCLVLALSPRGGYAQTVISIHSEVSCNSSNAGSSTPEDCQTLDMALEGLQSNTTLFLSPGNYTVRSNYSVMNKHDVSIIGNPDDPGSVIIECDESFGLVFISIRRLHVTGLTVRDCGFKGEDRVHEIFTFIRTFIFLFFEPLSDFSTGIFMVDCQDVTMKNVTIRENEGFGLVGINIVGNTHLSGVNLISNYPVRCVIKREDISQPGGTGGGLFLLYQDYVENELNELNNNSTLLFEYGLIEHNYNCRLDLFAVQYNKLSRSLDATFADNNTIVGSGGVTINIGQSLYHLNGSITHCNFTRNSGLYHSAGIEVTQFKKTSNCHVYVTNSLFYENGGLLNSLGDEAIDPFGAIVAAFYAPTPIEIVDSEVRSRLLFQAESTVSIHKCKFYGNTAKSGAGITVFSFGPTNSFVENKITISHCDFFGNKADYGSAIFVTEISYSAFESGLQVIIDSIKVVNNTRLDVSLSSSFQSGTTGVVDINYVNASIVGWNYFARNGATALSAYSAILTMSDKTEFIKNVGTNGGGMSLNTESYLVLTGQSTELVFKNNRALIYGGAIYVNFGAVRANTYDCFLFFDEIDVFCDTFDRCSFPNNRFLFRFVDNEAPFGSVIFGSTLQQCPWNPNGTNHVEYSDIANGLGDLDPNQFPILVDPPLKVDNTTVNTIAFTIWTLSSLGYVNNMTKTVAPGKEFDLPLGAFDRLEQSVPLTIFSQLGDNNVSIAYSEIGASNRFLLAGGDQKLLSDVPVRVYGAEGMDYIVTITSNEAAVQFNILVSLTNCSEGFVFNDTSLSCECEISMFLDGVTCNNDGTVNYKEDNWIGIDEDGNYIQAPCILGFCEPGISTIDFLKRDDQCRNNRSGILCGQCIEDHSRILGGNFCDLCDDNNYLSLIVLFAALGILLFIILALFNITITDGFINGFIFYANIISVYTSTFLPVTELRGTPPQVLISFLNLNFGIKSCFFDGATELDLAGLTLLFPVYLMLILLCVTLFGRWVTHKKVSSFLQKINVTHIFATLFLYSYASLLETCISLLAFINVDGAYPSLRWGRDPNVVYSPGLHLFLVILCAMIVAVLFPLPIVLLIPSVSFRVPYVKKLKPLIDAFIAPFAIGRSFWVSFRLLFRLLIYVIAAAGVSTEQLVSMSVLIASLTILQAYLKPYNTTSRNIVDILLMFNLTLFSIVAVFLFEKNQTNEQVIMDILFTFTYIFSIMLFVLFFHYLLKRFSCTRVPYEKVITWLSKEIHLVTDYLSDPTKCCTRKKKKDVGFFDNDISGNSGLGGVVTHTSIELTSRLEETTFSTLREVLLEDEPRSSTNSRQSSATS